MGQVVVNRMLQWVRELSSTVRAKTNAVDAVTAQLQWVRELSSTVSWNRLVSDPTPIWGFNGSVNFHPR